MLELIIVVTVIAIMAGLSWPRIMWLLKEQRLKDDTEQVRQQLDRGRVQAVDKGVAFQFRYEPNGRKFTLLPYEFLDAPAPVSAGTNARLAGGPGRGVGGNQPVPWPVFELSEECRFFVPSALEGGERLQTERLSPQWLEYLSDGPSHADVNWAPPVIYYPNGTATAGRLTVIDEDNRYLELSVRDLTGTVSVSPVQHRREMFGDRR
jgi:type II secretory pathway pseudopilin PulG